MAQILAGDIRKGVTFEYKSGVYTVTEFQHVKPGKGAAFVRCTLKNVVTGQVLSNETFNPTTKCNGTLASFPRKECTTVTFGSVETIFTFFH